MNFRGKHSDRRLEIDLAPLIDVVFMLLIFFMVTTTFNQHARIEVSLPEASAQPQPQQEKPLELVIDVEGHYYLNGRALVNTQPETLRTTLREAAAEHSAPVGELPMIIRADAQTDHQAVVTAMDSAARVGLVRLSIATTSSDAAGTQ